MSEAPHKNCPDCGQECERVIAAPIVSVRGASYRAAANAEKRSESYARAVGENTKLRQETLKKTGQVQERIAGHTHNCALFGCWGERDADPQSGQNEHPADEPKARRYGSLPHLVGDGAKAPAKPEPRK